VTSAFSFAARLEQWRLELKRMERDGTSAESMRPEQEYHRNAAYNGYQRGEMTAEEYGWMCRLIDRLEAGI